jgi:hypothetical protein
MDNLIVLKEHIAGFIALFAIVDYAGLTRFFNNFYLLFLLAQL